MSRAATAAIASALAASDSRHVFGVVSLYDFIVLPFAVHSRSLVQPCLYRPRCCVAFDRWSANDLASLLVGIFEQQGCWDPKDAEILLSISGIVDDGLSRYDKHGGSAYKYVLFQACKNASDDVQSAVRV